MNHPDGELTSDFVATDEVDQNSKAYIDTKACVEDIQDKYQEVTEEVIAKSNVQLTVNDPATGERAIRSAETNMGDFCADAYRMMMGAEIGFVNGGGIRTDISAGDVTYGDIIAVHPFNNTVCLAEVSGQQILDALELGAMYVGRAESGGFLQVSGMRYTIDSSIPSSVIVDENGSFVRVAGERRVLNPEVFNEKTKTYEPIHANATYKIAGHNYMLKNCGDGFSMFGKDHIKILKDETMVDSEVLIDYAKETLGGVIDEPYTDPYGQKRITIVKHYPDVEENTWYAPAVQYVSNAGLMDTTDGTHFSPRMNVSRAMVYQVFYQMEGCPEAGETVVPDTEGKWYHDCINWAANAGLFKGNTFGKDEDVKRCEIAEVMDRYVAYKNAVSVKSDSSFEKVPDYDKIPEENRDAMEFCYNNKIMIGDQNGMLWPNDFIVRCEFAQVLLNYDQFLK